MLTLMKTIKKKSIAILLKVPGTPSLQLKPLKKKEVLENS